MSFSSAVQQKRESVLAGALAAITWENSEPDISLIEFKNSKPWQSLCEQYRLWRKSLGDMIKAYQNIEQALDAGYLLDDKYADNEPTIRELHNGLQQTDIYKELWGHFTDVVGRLEKLKNIETQTDRQQTIESVRQNLKTKIQATEIIIALWQKINQLGDWPGTIAELELERELVLALRNILDERLKNSLRAESLTNKLQGQIPKHWQIYFSGISTPAEIDQAVKYMDDFLVDRDELATPSRYNLLIYERQKRISELSEKDQILSEVNNFTKEINSLSADFVSQAAVADLLEQLRKLTETDEEVVRAGPDPSKVGPTCSTVAAPLPWEVTTGNQGKSITYFWPEKNHKLTFLLVEPEDKKVPPTYLSTDEVSLGLFLDVIETAGKWNEITKLLPKPNQLRKGPCVWRFKNNKIRKNNKWVNIRVLAADESYYPPPATSRLCLRRTIRFNMFIQRRPCTFLTCWDADCRHR